MLHIHHSNRLELLRDALLQRLGGASADVFTAEQVIVPSAAHRRWLSLGVADAQGICANVHFDFLALWLWRQVARVVPGVADESPFAAAVLVWRVHAIFCDAGFVAGHARLQDYLRDADALMRYELAVEVAHLLEQYVTYRPDWLQAWRDGRAAPFGVGSPPEDAAWQAAGHHEDAASQAAGHHEDAAWQAAGHHEDAAWQAALWRRIDAELGMHAAHPAQAFVDALQRGGAQAVRRAALPPRLHVFALPAIAPLHLGLLQQLAQWLDVHVYVLNPCQEYWFDLIDRRRLGWLAARGRASGAEEEGNRLLAAWGTQTQAHIESLVEAGGQGGNDDAVDDVAFAPAPGTHLLAQLQNAMLELRPLEPGALTLAEGDRSIELHVCHSLTRELEVLHDHLLGLFAADPSLHPGDVLVVTPDLDAAAPLIDAVFGTMPKPRALPYALCGARRSRANPVARCLLALLALAGSRCSAGQVFGLLQQPQVARRFGLDDDALARLHDWLRDAGFHWALDAAQRARFDLPATSRHTLDDALQRLFLGYALPAAHGQPFAGLLGAGDAEGTEALALGALWSYATALGRMVDALQQPRLPEAWAALLSELTDAFVAPRDDELDDLRELRQTLRELAEDMHRGGATMPLPLPVVLSALQQRLDDAGGGGAAGGSINFTAMSSLRGLPFTVVCAIGMNDGAFPTPRRGPEFDLMALHPRRGDRQRRSDQRGLMLDLVLAARRSLYFSCSGRSQRDNTPLPPSVLLAELFELLQRAIVADAGDARALQQVQRRLVVEHPLQPFALPAFDVHGDARQRSFDAELAEALRRAQATAPAPPPADATAALPDEDDDDAAIDRAPGAPFFAAPLASPGPEWRQVALPRLLEFFRNPCRVLLRRRLGLELVHEAEELQDDEPLLPDADARRRLTQRLMPRLLEGADAASLPALARAGSEWPEGSLGEVELQRELQSLQQFAQRVRDALAEPVLAPCTFNLDLDLAGEPWQLQAAFADLRACGLQRWRHGPTRPADYLAAWLQHLVLCAAAPPGVARHTRWLSSDGEFSFEPCSDAARHLSDLLALYRQGLQQPLRFFARAGLALVDRGLDAARAEWWPSTHRPYAEGADPAYQLALRGIEDPLDAQFQQRARAVWLPLLAHLQDARR